MYLISTAKTTVLSEFKDLETKSIYQHSNGENTDFQFYAMQRIFVEVNKKSGLEIMRIKEKALSVDIQRVRKLAIDNVYCVACAKKSLEEMAVGLANGQVKLYNYNKSEFVHKFNADSNRNSVLYLDYNASDEYVASVFENGSINIYGHRTKAKLDTFNVDGNSILARFHPTKRFQLSVASYKGAVTVYDIQSKRILFNATDAHEAQCRDLCMSPGIPDTLISVGFDCVINIFDTRRKVKPLQLIYSHPLSTVAASECGKYFCVGNLKGELTTYDMRNTKMFLASKKVHDCGVTRVSFTTLAPDTSSSFSSSGVGAEHSLTAMPAETCKSVGPSLLTTTENNRAQRDSFCDFLDFQANRGKEKISPRFAPRRDSFDWEVLSRKLLDENRTSLVGVGALGTDTSPTVNESFENIVNSSEALKVPLKDRSNISHTTSLMGKLTQIVEEEKGVQDITEMSNHDIFTTDSDKENPNLDLNSVSTNLKCLPIGFKSTPQPERTPLEGTSPIPKNHSTSHATSTAAKPTTPQANPNYPQDFQQAISDLRTEMLQRFDKFEFEMKFLAENNKWQLLTQSFNLWNQSGQFSEEVRDCLGVLMQTDPFVNEFLRLKEENELLKQQLNNLTKK